MSARPRGYAEAGPAKSGCGIDVARLCAGSMKYASNSPGSSGVI